MANIQKQFEEFNKKIRLGKFQEEQILRDKRNIIQKKIWDNLPAVFEKYKEENLVPTFRDQGSYEMGTGTKPLDCDYDIDQGVYFEVATKDYPDPVILKQRIVEALNGHTGKIRIRRPCVTVFYQKASEDLYHVDLAIYSCRDMNADRKDYLAMGKENSNAEFRVWQESDPQGLKNRIFERFQRDANGRRQFRRVIRYLKRWKDINFFSDGNHAPRGIALTISAHEGFQPQYSDFLAQKMDDLSALLNLVNAMLNVFQWIWRTGEEKHARRLIAYLPVDPKTDLYERMTDVQMSTLEEELKKLRDALVYAKNEVDPVEACEKLQKQLGSDFPIPAKPDTAKNNLSPVVSSGNAA